MTLDFGAEMLLKVELSCQTEPYQHFGTSRSSFGANDSELKQLVVSVLTTKMFHLLNSRLSSSVETSLNFVARSDIFLLFLVPRTRKTLNSVFVLLFSGQKSQLSFLRMGKIFFFLSFWRGRLSVFPFSPNLSPLSFSVRTWVECGETFFARSSIFLGHSEVDVEFSLCFICSGPWWFPWWPLN